MSNTLRKVFAVAALATLATLGAAAAAAAEGRPGGGPGPNWQWARGHAVFVQTNGLTGNAIDVLAEHPDGRLSLRQVVATGGLGGQAAGSVADTVASQGSLAYDQGSGLLFAVNAMPTVTAGPGNVPFAFAFSPSGQLVAAEAANSTLHTYALGSGGASRA